MSYIHEALKKAQRERDGHYQKYSKTLLARTKNRRVFSNRAVWGGGLVVLILSAAFTLYIWHHGTTRVTETSAPGMAKPMRPSPTEKTSNAKGLFEEAVRLHKAGRMEDAQRLYHDVLTRDPGYVDALNNLGVLWIQEKNYPEAKKNFYKAILLNARYVDPHYNLACVYALEGETSRGMAHLKKAVALDKSVVQWATSDPDLENLRQMPQFEKLLTEVERSASNP